METSESIYIKCNCGCNVLEINFEEFFEDKGQFYIAQWVSHPGVPKMSKKERIRWCEHVMKTGRPWADHTIVTKQDAQRIVEFLTKKITQYGKKKSSRK